MKKLFTVLLVAFLVLMLGAPLVNGVLMQRVVRNAHDQANALYAESGSGATLEIVRYDRGYRFSEIEWKLRLGQLSTLYGVEEIIFVDRARHGLLGIVSETSLEKNPWFNELVALNAASENPLQITTSYRLTGEIESTIIVSPVEAMVEQDRLQIGPGRLIVTSDSSFTAIQSEGSLQSVSIGDTFSLAGLSLSSDLRKISTYIWDGTIAVSIDQGRAVDQDGSLAFETMQGSYFLDFDNKRGLLLIGAELAAENLNFAETPVERPRIRIEMSNVDAEGYERYLEIYSDMASSMLGEIGTGDAGHETTPDTLTDNLTMAGMQLLAAGELLLRKDLQLRISDLFARLPSGDITGSLVVRLQEDLSLMQLAALTNQPSRVFQLFSWQSSLSLPAILVDDPLSLTTPLHPAMTTGFFRQDGEQLVHRAETRDNRLFLNDKEVVLD